MYKTKDLEKVLKYLKDNDIQEFDARGRGSSFEGPFGEVPTKIEFLLENNNINLVRTVETENYKTEGKVYVIKQENL